MIKFFTVWYLLTSLSLQNLIFNTPFLIRYHRINRKPLALYTERRVSELPRKNNNNSPAILVSNHEQSLYTTQHHHNMHHPYNRSVMMKFILWRHPHIIPSTIIKMVVLCRRKWLLDYRSSGLLVMDKVVVSRYYVFHYLQWSCKVACNWPRYRHRIPWYGEHQ